MSKVKLIGIATSVAGAALMAAGARFPASSYASALCLELGSLTLGLGIGVLLVNYYFDLDVRRIAIQALLRLVGPSIAEHHSKLLEESYKVFGKGEFEQLVTEYVKRKGDPKALNPEQRKRLYELVKLNMNSFRPLLVRIEADMRELTGVLGWSFNPDILRDALQCRHAIGELMKREFDDTPEVMLAVCEHFLDVDLMAHQVFEEMRRVGNLRESDVYGKD